MVTGSISGFSFIIIGVPTESSQPPESSSTWELISIMAVFISAPDSNSITTSERFSLDVEDRPFTSVSVAKAASMGRVISDSTFSGVAPV